MLKFVSWNVNGLRAVVSKGFAELFRQLDADFVCLQETKLREGQIDLEFEGYTSHWDYAERPGYSGTVTYTRHKPVSTRTGIGRPEHDNEGRVVTLDMGNFWLVNVYTPNSQTELARLPYHIEWEDAFLDYVKRLDSEKPVVICGDLNVAHKEIDLANPRSNRNSAGFTDQERNCMTRLLDSGFVDTYRYLYPDRTGAYSWWSYRGRAREKNVGWRIDYFIVSERLAKAIKQADILNDMTGSDHCPVSLVLEAECSR